MYVCMYVCVSVCVSVCIHTYISIYAHPPTTRKNAHFAHLSITVIRQRLRKSKNPKIENEKKMQDSVDVKSFGFLDFWNFEILENF